MILWRISEHATLDGAGGLVVGGRWHSKGRPIIYCAESSALAMLEALVHLEVATLPPPFQMLRIEAPDTLDVTHWPKERHVRDMRHTVKWGDTWLAERKTALARVPSVVAPGGANWLINPLHRDAARVRLIDASRQPWDRRLFREV